MSGASLREDAIPLAYHHHLLHSPCVSTTILTDPGGSDVGDGGRLSGVGTGGRGGRRLHDRAAFQLHHHVLGGPPHIHRTLQNRTFKKCTELHFHSSSGPPPHLFCHCTFTLPPQKCPIYHQVVKEPMDLRTVARKIQALEYCTVDDMINDFMLIVANAKSYNEPHTRTYKVPVTINVVIFSIVVAASTTCSPHLPPRRRRTQ